MHKRPEMILLYILCLVSTASMYAAAPDAHEILLINSYHEGYIWSDEIIQGISTTLASSAGSYELQVEYMDTQHITQAGYEGSLRDLYDYKYSDRRFDALIASDDAAFRFLLSYGDELFPETPIVFCGVNYFEQAMIADHPLVTGVVENYDIAGTIRAALHQHPGTRRIYYLDDDTMTGTSIMKEFISVTGEFEGLVDFRRLDGKDYESILAQASDLPEDSIILFLIYFQDRSGSLFSYDEAVSSLYTVSRVPIYGVWDFHLGHGIVGGKLVSGFNQGQMAAQQVLQILSGMHPADIAVRTDDTTFYAFDHQVLSRFAIPTGSLPENSRVIRVSDQQKYQVLMLHSYNRGLQWTDDIERGIMDALSARAEQIEFSIDYMDVKRNPDSKYLQTLYDFLSRKYLFNDFDLVITSDDAAFEFMRTYQDLLPDDTPIFFCGVNHIDDDSMDVSERVTGVVESYDITSTLDTALSLHAGVKRIIVINDTTMTGKANRKNLLQIIPEYADRISFEFWEDYNMDELLGMCEQAGDDSLIFLLSFNRDHSYNDFTYDESLGLISSHTKVPIYALWDFYLGKGIVGGMLTSGYSQGSSVGEMVDRYLSGTPVAAMPVQSTGMNRYMFDHQQLRSFDIPVSALPEDSLIINRPFSLEDFLRENAVMILIIMLLCIILLLMLKTIRLSKMTMIREHRHARTDTLTGIPNRRAGHEELSRQIQAAAEDSGSLTVCFCDVNDLKQVNDQYGHDAGDTLICELGRLFDQSVRSGDMVCRLGGDEFLLIFPGADITQAEDIIARISGKTDTINAAGTYPFPMSFSSGFAAYDPEDCHTVAELIQTADSRMYLQKLQRKRLRGDLTEAADT